MVDWNIIRYITDKISQGENPEDIKKRLIGNGYDIKLINESFNQAIPWLKPGDQKRVQNLQTQSVTTEPSTVPQPGIDKPFPHAQSQGAIKIPIYDESKVEIKSEQNVELSTKKIFKSLYKNKWLYISIILGIVSIAVILYFLLR